MHKLHRIEIHPTYTLNGDPDGYEVHNHHIDGKIEKTRHASAQKASDHAQQSLEGHESAFNNQISGVPQRQQPPVRQY